MKRLFFFLLLGCMFFPSLHAQTATPTTSDGQIWFDAELNYTYRQRWLFQNELSFQTLIWGGSHWFSYNTTPDAEYNVNKNLDIICAIPISYTRQTAVLNTFEIRTMLGSRIYFTPTKRIQTRLLVRWEYRWFYDEDTDVWDKGNRFRLRAELVIPLNKDSYFVDNMWYLINDVEIFLWQGAKLPERYANKTRIRLGLGYRLNYKVRFELIYINQDSRNNIEDDFNAHSDIFRLRLKYYFK